MDDLVKCWNGKPLELLDPGARLTFTIETSSEFLSNVSDGSIESKRTDTGWYFASGFLALTTDGATVEEQMDCAMQRLAGAYSAAISPFRVAASSVSDRLARDDVSFADLVSVHVSIKHMSDFARINSVYRRHFRLNPPTRVCISADLPLNVTAQFDVTAPRRDDDVSVRNTMHVQSVSHWAPANIGPYSQCVQVDASKVFVSGQIALVPGSMRLLDDDVAAQARLSLQHVDRILRAMTSKSGEETSLHIGACCLVICYVTDVR